jgi:hypothetical protein
MDIRSRTKIAFVVERYALDEVSEVARRTRAMATAMAARGHDVTVLTTCARDPDRWENGVAEGKADIEGVHVVRFRLTKAKNEWLGGPARLLASYHPRAARLSALALGPRCIGYRRYLEHLGYLFDAVFFTGFWGYLVAEGVTRVRNAVLCPAPLDDPTRSLGHAAALFRAARAVAVATPKENDRLQQQTQRSWSCPSYVTGAGPDPLPALTLRMRRMRLVDGPYLLHVGHIGPSTKPLVEAFRFFREAHADTPLEDDTGERMAVKDVRLVLAGDYRFPHAPEEGVLSIGPVDDTVRGVLLHRALAVVHPDPANRLPTELLVAWSHGRPTLVHTGSDALSPVLDLVGKESVYDSPSTFAASAASLLSSRSPRRVFGARARELVRRTYSPSKLSEGMEECLRGVMGRAGGKVVSIDSGM